MILECCTDYWNGKDLGILNDQVERKISEFYQNAIISDMHVIAYAYRPLHQPLVRKFLKSPCKTPIYVDMTCISESPLQVTEAASVLSSAVGSSINQAIESLIESTQQSQFNQNIAISANYSRQRRYPIQSRSVSKVDSAFTLADLPEQEFTNEVIKGQTLLGLASFMFSPKPVNCFQNSFCISYLLECC